MLKSIVRMGFGLAGLAVFNRAKLGLDPFQDVLTLAKGWGRTVDMIFDVGANVGQTSARLDRMFPHAVVHAFEPNPDTFETLARRFARGSRVRPHALALGPRTETRTLHVFDDSKVNSLRADSPHAIEYNKQGAEVSVSCMSLDGFCDQHGISAIDLLKIDTEGFDLDVLQGAQTMLSRGAIDFVYCEFNSLFATDEAPGELGPIGRLLAQHGLRFVASYVDSINTSRGMFMVSNALFALPGKGAP